VSGTRRKTEKARVIRFFIHVLLVVFLDQLTKILMLRWLAEGQSIPVIQDVFHFTLVYNTGIAFGLFHEHGFFLLFLITASLVVLALVYRAMSSQGILAKLSMVLIFGGAIGNWIDRVRVHAVIDFLDFRVFPVFNLADTSITLGVVCYLWLALGFKDPFKKTSESSQPSSNP